ncbi:MAG: 2-amino-4-hydroxy-6-hydroxymethyldihydropteridine diphosphokinase [Desulfobulbaceae bacterium]|nr:2-amino-4-hydroxy-6-hydroxymethyldihydropteridine diphosphokinase [Desulfobulbaceae bacterium]
MALAFIGLGSNLGDGRAYLKEAWQRLGKTKGIMVLALSSPYETAPVGMQSKQWFTNAAGAIDTKLSPEELLTTLLEIEQSLGRDRSKGEDRTVDLDLLLYDDLILHKEELEIPHPEMSHRLFVLAPLEELAPDHLHPQAELTIRQMRRNLVDNEQQIRKGCWQEREKH